MDRIDLKQSQLVRNPIKSAGRAPALAWPGVALCSVLASSGLAGQSARAQGAPSSAPAPPTATVEAFNPDASGGSVLDPVIVTGTREGGVTESDSPAPVQVVNSAALTKTPSTPDLVQTLASVAPSLYTTTTGGDLSNLTLQAALRGLSPNDTLILIDGKRRHTTANINVSAAGPFTGGAGADLNFIPVDAIDHIEVLTDGAAAQYGSDAIAGVINIILKKNFQGGNLQASDGGYQDGGGRTPDITGHIGFQPYEGAFINFTAEYRNHGFTVRDQALSYIVNPNSSSGLYPVAGLKPIDQNVLNAAGWPVLNRIGGDAQYNLKLAEFNSGFRLSDAVELYSFGTLGQKGASTIENYRLPHIAAYTNPTTGVTQYQYPFGFTPFENIQETDYGLTAGLRGDLAGWHWDLSSTYGEDHNDFNTLDSSNTYEYGATGYTPTDFYDGAFATTQWTNNLDLTRAFDVGLAGPLSLAVGVEQRRDTYGITAGTPWSYQEGGAASFQGFSPTDAGTHSRDNEAGYVDLAGKVIGNLRLDLAGRFEHYSDFGSARSGKLTARYDFTPAVALRGTLSNGFRAPTVAEEFYTKSATSPTSTGVTLAANAPATALFGLGNLQPETSVNYSLGAVFRPTPRFTSTLDLYQINLDHRIVQTTSLYYLLNGVVISPLVAQAVTVNGNQLNPTFTSVYANFFANGVDTRTQGADLVLDYLSDFNQFGRVDWNLNASYNHTVISSIRSTPTALAAQGLQLLDASSFTGLSGGLPKYDVDIGAAWNLDRLYINLREIIHDTNNSLASDDGATRPGKITYFTEQSGIIPITNLEVGYDVLQPLRLSVGAVNVFNRYPDKINPALLAAYQKAGYSFAATQYTSSPIGIDGGYYYLKAAYSF